MKTLLRTSLLALVLAFVFGACQKVETFQPKLNEERTATVHFFCGYDASVMGVEFADEHPELPGAVKAMLSTTYSNLGIDGNNSMYIKDFDLSGKEVTVQIPVAAEGTDYSFNFTAFSATFEYMLNGEKRSREMLFDTESMPSGDLTNLKPGEERVIRLLFSSSSSETIKPKRTATVRFLLGIDTNSFDPKPGDEYDKLPKVPVWFESSSTLAQLFGGESTEFYVMKMDLQGSEMIIEFPVEESGTSYAVRFNQFVNRKKYPKPGNPSEDEKEDVFFDQSSFVSGDLNNLMPGEERLVKLLFVSSANAKAEFVR